jgi:hypothetical protein
MEGYPIGAAMEWFNQRYAALAAELTGALYKVALGIPLCPEDLLRTASLWTRHNDARNYIIVGDPAVRLRVGDGGGPWTSRCAPPRDQARLKAEDARIALSAAELLSPGSASPPGRSLYSTGA